MFATGIQKRFHHRDTEAQRFEILFFSEFPGSLWFKENSVPRGELVFLLLHQTHAFGVDDRAIDAQRQLKSAGDANVDTWA